MEDKTCHMEGDLWELMDLGLMIKDFVVHTEGKRISFRGQSHVQAFPFLKKRLFPPISNFMKSFLTKNMLIINKRHSLGRFIWNSIFSINPHHIMRFLPEYGNIVI